MMAKLIQVIETSEPRGVGTAQNPHRIVAQLWSTDGELLMERDPCAAPCIWGQKPLTDAEKDEAVEAFRASIESQSR